VNPLSAQSIVETLGLVGVFMVLLAETGLLIGLVLPGDSLLFVAGVAASGSGAAILGGAHLKTLPLFIGAPLAAIIGAQVGHMLGAVFGRTLFDRPDGRIFNQQRVASTEKWLLKYGVGRALVLARFIPVIRTLVNPMAGITHISAKRFFIWNALGGLLWTELVLGIGYVVGEKLKGSVDKYLLPVVALIVVISFIPVAIEFFREWSTRKHHS
jgi:membrane-associated protein